MAEPDWARPVVAWEITAKDPGTLSAFYRELFNWTMTDGDVIRIAAGVGGPLPGPIGTMRNGAHTGVTLFVQVRDLDQTIAKAKGLGAKVLRQPVDTPGGATFAAILDPEGNRLGLVQQ